MPRDPESQLSFDVRAQFALLDCVTVQVIEAGLPGPADVIVEDVGHWWWLELKVNAPLRREQRLFLRRRWLMNYNAFLLKRYLDREGFVTRHVLWRGIDPLQAGHEIWTGGGLDCKEIYKKMLSFGGD